MLATCNPNVLVTTCNCATKSPSITRCLILVVEYPQYIVIETMTENDGRQRTSSEYPQAHLGAVLDNVTDSSRKAVRYGGR